MENTEELYTNVDILKQEYLFQLKDEPNLSVFIHLQNVEKLLKQLKSEVKILFQKEQKRIYGPLNNI
ncbi:hypothetical protein [uncultured Leptotrichia sp.]|uniref:hypothetical protein n=1 Tax=uncultured Leptotrichia sp. TaxID=159271 RepID=UPI0025D1E395|nr:hypothetical protein [uncultured Leptotrichia sp.]